jgi:ankyrin repeat protein
VKAHKNFGSRQLPPLAPAAFEDFCESGVRFGIVRADHGERAFGRMKRTTGAVASAGVTMRPLLCSVRWNSVAGVSGLLATLLLIGFCQHRAHSRACARERLLLGAEAGEPSQVKCALQSGAAVDARDDTGMTALALAARSGRNAVVAQLLAAGADPNAACGRQGTPIVSAAKNEHVEVVRMLLAAGARPDERDCLGACSLWYAASNGCAPVVELLLDAGAKPNLPTNWGSTPAFEAARAGQSEVVAVLARHGVETTPTVKDGTTAPDVSKADGW